jgi:hypothetical protein
LSPEVAERLDRVAATMYANQVTGAPVAQRTAAVRAALLAGLPVLEARLGLSTGVEQPGTPTKRETGALQPPDKM